MPGFDQEDLLETFAQNLPGAAFFFEIDSAGRESVRFLNSRCEQIWSVSASQIDGDPKPLWDMVAPDDLPHLQESVAASAKTLSIWEARFRIRDGLGAKKTLLSRGTPKRLDGGGVRWLTFLFDVTAQTRTEQLFEVVTQQLNYISTAIPDGFALFDARERLVVCNALFRSAYGIDPHTDIKGRTYEEIVTTAAHSAFLPGAVGREPDWIESALRSFRRADETVVEPWTDSRWMKVLDRPTEDGGRVAFRIDVTEAVNRKNELEKAAGTDALTGLLNRRGLAGFFPVAIERLGTQDRLVLMHIDLDKFKAINDVNGHEAGDFVLMQTARRLMDHSAGDMEVARVGGDEFVLARISGQADEDVVALAEKLRDSITAPLRFKDRLCQVGATIGVATWTPADGVAVEQALMDADTALLAGKSMGRNQTVLFRDDMRGSAVETANLAAQIKEGIRQGAFEPFFQPQVTSPSGRIIGLEALARWKKDDGSFVPAASFIEVANETGLITEIDKAILRGSLGLLAELTRRDIDCPRVSINLSSMQLGSETVVERLLDECFGHNISASQVNIEVLESTLLDDRADAIGRNINALAEAGFRIELDDFGTGHTALASLTRFPVHQIKVDRSLVQGIDQDTKKRAIVGGLYLVCERLGIDVIAEGVEDAAELKTLQHIGFTSFQGYYFARPMSVQHLFEWIDTRQRTVG